MGRVTDIPGFRVIGCGKTVKKNGVEGALDNKVKTRDFV